MQLMAFVDDIDIIAQTHTALRRAFLSLEKETLRMGLKINEKKTKYSEINNRNDCTSEIQKTITMAYTCLNGIRKYMKSNLIKRKTKALLYSSLLRSVLTYACETWSISRTDENMISIYTKERFSFLEEFRKMEHGEEDQI
ncbi:uncharacterized protein TNCV_4377071 [Trichonephila clavipes]|nr:uncharacterized protein TNCV_4377071 [Trichonephila clavipes]